MASQAASGVPGDAGSLQMDEIAQCIQVVPEKTMLEISKGPLGRFMQSCDDIQKVRGVWQSLLKTFATASISHSHTSVSCNTLSVFLDAARISKCEGTRQLVLSRETWLSVFEAFLIRFKDGKPKPMKQLLESLVALLTKNVAEQDRRFIKSRVINATVPSIVLNERRSQLKACLVTLEILIRKNALSPIELITMVHTWLEENGSRWMPLFQEDCKALSIDVTQFSERTNEGSVNLGSQRTAAEVFLLALLAQAKSFDLAAGPGDTMTALFQKIKALPQDSYSHEDVQSLLSVWVAPVRHVILQNMHLLEPMSSYFLHPLFCIDPVGFRDFLNQLPLENLLTGDMHDAPVDELSLLFASLQMAKKIGLVHEDHTSPKGPTAKTGAADEGLVLKSEVIGHFLFHRDFSIRIAALSLLITANATTKPFTSSTMRAILNGLPSLHAESDAYSRGEILSIMRKLIPRLKGGIMSSEQNWAEVMASANKKQPPNYARDDAETRACLTEYLEFLKADLQPTASYPRHITSLKTLILLLESGLDARFEGSIVSKSEGNLTKWKINAEVFEPNLLRLLIDLLLDPFEEVRARSLSIVNLFPRDILFDNAVQLGRNAWGKAQLLGALGTAEQMASRTSRADYADTVARLYHILFCAAQQRNPNASQWWETKVGVVHAILKRLESKLSVSGAIARYHLRDAPLHGHVSALRYIVAMSDFHALISDPESPSSEDWRSIHVRIVSVSDKIWNEVKPVLCIDSPEGHSDEPAEGLSVGPKDILSYSWRALRESSLLLHATLANSTYGPQGPSGLVYDDYEKIGTSSFTQLAELRHRGAFSTVSQTFATCCLRCGQSSDPEISGLPARWYQDARKIIFEAASKLTRRSAGLPALITGIISAKPGGPLFQEVVDDLHEISHLLATHDSNKQDLELPQVHAMNCLKDIFTNTKFGAFTEAYIMPTLTLSAERIGSPIWALRNCGLMLFRALLTRICRTGTGLGFGGKSGSEPGARVSFQKYPGLIQLLSTLLTEEDTRNIALENDHSVVTERVFPALELIAEKVPNVYDVDDNMILGLVKTQLSSPVWGIREHAARVYASILNRSDIIRDIKSLVDADAESKSQDLLHGKALCVKYALRRFALVSNSLWNEQINEMSSFIKHLFAVLFPLSESPFVATALVEVLTEAVLKSFDSGAEATFLGTLNYIFDTHSLNDIVDFIFDSSHPSWKSLSTTRAASLLRRALSWAAVLRMVGIGECKEMESFIFRVSCFDANAGVWLLEQLQDAFGDNVGNRITLLRLYSAVIVGAYPEDVKTSAVAGLASSLESVLDFNSDNFHGIMLPWEALDRQINLGPDAPVCNRDRSDAELRLQGCLLAAKVLANECQSLQEDVTRWAIKLRYAMQEETEFTTRHAAVASITGFGRVLRSPGKSPVAEPFFLEPYMILYDMLNDDDEELRDLAAVTASWVLSYSSVAPSKAVTLSPLNASQLLMDFIVGHYAGSPLLCIRIMRYITGQEVRMGGSTHTRRLAPVSDLVTEYRKESTTLFEEEKQNLFIDEVREVDRWSGRLLELAESSYDGRSTASVFQWVSDGLSYLIELAVDDSGAGKDGFIGWTTNPDTFTLGVRLISLASVMARPGFPASKSLGGDGQTLKEKLQLLYMHGKTASLHVDWLSRIRRAVGSS